MDPTAGPEDISVIASNLPIDIDQRSLEQVFSRFGPVKVKLITSRATCATVGYGFAHFKARQHAADAVAALNGSVLAPGSAPIKCTLAKPREERGFNTNLYISGIPVSWAEGNLREIAEPFGEVLELKLLDPQ
eukprot:Partr_v1_DN7161_c1_g1_i1_m18179 putative ELAV (embryonic lethal, abnormal vision, Drosophila)-like